MSYNWNIIYLLISVWLLAVPFPHKSLSFSCQEWCGEIESSVAWFSWWSDKFQIFLEYIGASMQCDLMGKLSRTCRLYGLQPSRSDYGILIRHNETQNFSHNVGGRGKCWSLAKFWKLKKKKKSISVQRINKQTKKIKKVNFFCLNS